MGPRPQQFWNRREGQNFSRVNCHYSLDLRITSYSSRAQDVQASERAAWFNGGSHRAIVDTREEDRLGAPWKRVTADADTMGRMRLSARTLLREVTMGLAIPIRNSQLLRGKRPQTGLAKTANGLLSSRKTIFPDMRR